MTNSEDIFNNFLIDNSGKRQYQPPKLIVFGKVAVLTQSGSQDCRGDNATCEAGGNNMGMASDQAAKENIVRIGTHPLGIGLYLFDYKPLFRDQWGHGRQFGVMAQEVETVMPQAVSEHSDGYKMVDYRMLGISHTIH